ncbi:MAG TPA: metalloprotease family protein, partial [Thermoanaerobaculia bacterium]|nr:metalloprotease family protein [Thermoanaerobaculia bacterium]
CVGNQNAVGDVSARMKRIASAALIVAVVAGSLRLFTMLWHRDALEDLPTQPGGWLGAIAIVIASAVVHELLHAIGWRFIARVPFSIRPTWSVMGFAAEPDAPVPARTYRIVAALPALLLAVPAILGGLALGNGLVMLWGGFFLLECFSDFARARAATTLR